MAEPDQEEFDANERIAGFSLLAIRDAIRFVGITDDRDDVKHVSTALKCGRYQAQHVLERLDQRGLVEKAARKGRWKTTALGHKLAFEWHPPRTLRPAIRHAKESIVVLTHCGDAPCSIWRSSPDGDAMFEEAELHLALNPEYEGERLVEVEVIQLDDYQGERSGGGESALAVHVSAEGARSLAAGLLKAAELAERETERRAKTQARREKRKVAATRTRKVREESGGEGR